MHKKLWPRAALSMLAAAALISACGGHNQAPSGAGTGGGSSGGSGIVPTTLDSLVLFDAARAPLAGADVTVEEDAPAAALIAKASQKVTTDKDGQAKVKLKPKTKFKMTVAKGSAPPVTVKLEIKEESASSSSALITPLSCNGGQTSCTDVSSSALIGSIAGTVSCDGKLAQNAQVSISGGGGDQWQFRHGGHECPG